MVIFNGILEIVNLVLCTIVGVAFIFQIFYIFLFFLPAKKYPKAKAKHKIGVIIPARNEQECIGNTIINILKSNYPLDKFEIIVLADNCTDDTVTICKNLGVRVIERHENDKKKHNVGYALKYLFEQLKDEIDYFEFFIRFDADTVVDCEYLNKMNDAFESGVKVAKGYNHASNLTQNLIAGVSGLWYLRDNRFNCQARSALKTDVFLVGSGMMFSAEIIKEDGGWNAVGSSEDTEFTIENLNKKRKCNYVSDAIIYDDQPSTLKALFNRNMRMGKGLHKLFWKDGMKCLFKFFTTFRYCYLDMFLNLLFIPIAVVCCLWFPLYYGYVLLFNWLSALGDPAVAMENLKIILIILFCAFLIPFIAQALLVYFLDKKKINQPFKKLAKAIFAFPLFMIVYAIGIVIGVFSRGKWKKIDRNVEYSKKV